MTSVDYSAEAVTARLRQASQVSELRSTQRLSGKIDMSPEAITRRLRRVSDLRDACLALARGRGAR
jgi:hypothetical protein